MKKTHGKLFYNRIDKTIESNDRKSTLDLTIPRKQQSVHEITKHYTEFQHALYTLKTAVEELWRLELEQLRDHEPVSSTLLNGRFDLQVPSIYTCRTILPVASETLHSKNEISTSVNSPMILQHIPAASNHQSMSSKIEINGKMNQSNTQFVPRKQKSTKTLLSVSKSQKQYGSGDNSIKYCTNTALLHLKFRCAKHTHSQRATRQFI